MGIFGGPFVYTNKKNDKYWLHKKERGKRKLYYFTKDPIEAISSLPKGYEVVESTSSGLPFLKKKEGDWLSGLLKKGDKEK